MNGWKTTLKLICQWTNMSQSSDQASNFNSRQLFCQFVVHNLSAINFILLIIIIIIYGFTSVLHAGTRWTGIHVSHISWLVDLFRSYVIRHFVYGIIHLESNFKSTEKVSKLLFFNIKYSN